MPTQSSVIVNIIVSQPSLADDSAVTSIADYFVVCTATSNTHVKALSGEVEYQLGRRNVNAYHIEGRDNNSWVVLDYCNVLVHIFNREARDFYNLDKLYENTSAVEE